MEAVGIEGPTELVAAIRFTASCSIHSCCSEENAGGGPGFLPVVGCRAQPLLLIHRTITLTNFQQIITIVAATQSYAEYTSSDVVFIVLVV